LPGKPLQGDAQAEDDLPKVKPAKLDEHVFDRHIAAADAVKRRTAQAARERRNAEPGRVGRAEVVELEVSP